MPKPKPSPAPPKKKRRTAQDTFNQVFSQTADLYMLERVHARFGAILAALLDVTIGVRIVLAKDATTGQWAQVTDPAALEALFNDPTKPSWTIYTRAPDRDLLASVLAWQIGPPFTAASPNLMDLLVANPPTDDPIPLRERLAHLRAGPSGPVPQVAEPLEDDPTRVH